MTVHVTEKTQGQRQWASQMADQFNRHHNWSQPHNRAAEVFEVTDGENGQSDRGIGVQVCGRREEAGDQSNQVRRQDEERDGCNQREVGFPFVSHGFFDHVLDAVDDRLKEVLQARRNGFDATLNQNSDKDAVVARATQRK